jgi:hypothetical protein
VATNETPLNPLAARLTDTANAISHALGAPNPVRVNPRVGSDGTGQPRGRLSVVA